MSSETGTRGKGGEGRREVKAAATSAGEWVVAGLGLVLVLATLGYLLFQAVTEPAEPPLIAVEAGQPRQFAAGYQLSFSARNAGNETAANVTIVGELLANGSPVESSQTTLDYIPAESQRNGGLFFSRDPGEYVLELRAVGYETP